MLLIVDLARKLEACMAVHVGGPSGGFFLGAWFPGSPEANARCSKPIQEPTAPYSFPFPTVRLTQGGEGVGGIGSKHRLEVRRCWQHRWELSHPLLAGCLPTGRSLIVGREGGTGIHAGQCFLPSFQQSCTSTIRSGGVRKQASKQAMWEVRLDRLPWVGRH